jgi:C-terminal domain of 1-Cys peroxiredoxin
MTNGRSIDEFLRLAVPLQTPHRHKAATPVGWRHGDKVSVPPTAAGPAWMRGRTAVAGISAGKHSKVGIARVRFAHGKPGFIYIIVY